MLPSAAGRGRADSLSLAAALLLEADPGAGVDVGLAVDPDGISVSESSLPDSAANRPPTMSARSSSRAARDRPEA
jgi:hypothetical protein